MGDIIGGALGLIGGSEQAGATKSAAKTSAAASRYATDVQKQMYDQNRIDQNPWRTGGQNALERLLMGMGIDVPMSYAEAPETRAQIMERLTPEYTSTLTSPTQTAPGDESSTPYLFGSSTPYLSQTTTNVDYDRLNAAVDAEFAKQNAAAGKNKERSADFGSLANNFTLADYQADPGYAFRLAEGQKALERSAAARGGLYSGRAMKDMNAYAQGQASQEYGNAYNRYQSNQNNQYNRLASIAGVGQTANNALAQSGQNYANQVGNLTMTNAANQGNAALVGANARMSGYAGLGNALGKVNWGSLGGGSGGSGSSPGFTYNGTNGAEDFTNGWNSSNYG